MKQERVKSIIAKVELDSEAQKVILRLEPRTIITTDVDKGKGRVFDFETSKTVTGDEVERKFMAGALNDGNTLMRRLGFDDLRSTLELSRALKGGFPPAGFTEYMALVSPRLVHPGLVWLKENQEKRQVKRLRKLNQSKDGFVGPVSEVKKNGKGVAGPKRKGVTQREPRSHISRRKNQKVIPCEGSPAI